MSNPVTEALDLAAEKLGLAVFGPGILVQKNDDDARSFDGAAGIEIGHDADKVLDVIPVTKGHSTIRLTMVSKTGQSLVITSTVNRDQLRKLIDG